MGIVTSTQKLQHCDGSALRWAAVRHRSDTMRKIFELCEGMELLCTILRSALVLAMEHCSWTVIRILIANGADANTKESGFGHVLQAASWKGDADFVRPLLSAGIDVSAWAGQYGNALQAAAWKEHEFIAKLPLNKGTDVKGRPAKHGAAAN